MKYRIWDLLYVKDFSFISKLSIFQKISLVVLVIGGVLGYKYGVLVVVLYILQGILGFLGVANFNNFYNIIKKGKFLMCLALKI
jgi:hypothetical protein